MGTYYSNLSTETIVACYYVCYSIFMLVKFKLQSLGNLCVEQNCSSTGEEMYAAERGSQNLKKKAACTSFVLMYLS